MDRDLLSSLETPVVQAGMGFVAGHELAAAVSEAGGLGMIAASATPLAEELAAARRLTGRPIAVNLLLPFARTADFEAAATADAIVTFWGEPARPARGFWMHQCGSVQEAVAAAAAGADAVVAQGVEAGGHVRGTTPMLELVEQVRAAVSVPVLAAGGIIDAHDVRAALDAGAVAAVVGTASAKAASGSRRTGSGRPRRSPGRPSSRLSDARVSSNSVKSGPGRGRAGRYWRSMTPARPAPADKSGARPEARQTMHEMPAWCGAARPELRI
jgi:hypothetical protein